MDEFDQQQDALLDSALDELPLEPLPSDFTRRVMAGVHAVQREAMPAASIRFRLQFLDIALALFCSLALILIWLATLWWTGLLSLEWLPQAQAGLFLVEQLSLANASLLFSGIILLILEMSLLGLVGVSLFGGTAVHSLE